MRLGDQLPRLNAVVIVRASIESRLIVHGSNTVRRYYNVLRALYAIFASANDFAKIRPTLAIRYVARSLQNCKS